MVKSAIVVLIRRQIIGVAVALRRLAVGSLAGENRGAPTHAVGCRKSASVDAHQHAPERLCDGECFGHQRQHGGIQSKTCHLHPANCAGRRNASHMLDLEAIPSSCVGNPARAGRVGPFLLVQFESFHAKMPVRIVERRQRCSLCLVPA